MKRIAVLRLFIPFAVTTALSTAAVAQTSPPPSGQITVSGEATIDAAPDVAVVHTGVTIQARTAREASEANAKIMTAVMAALKASGIDDRDVRTSRLSIDAVRDQENGAAPRVVGFRASNQVSVKVRNIASVADVVDSTIKAGANTLGGIEFLVSNPAPLLDQARPAAIADAKRKAEIYAKAAGVHVGRVITISEGGTASPAMMRAASMAAPSTPVSPGQMTLGLSVAVVFQIVP